MRVSWLLLIVWYYFAMARQNQVNALALTSLLHQPYHAGHLQRLEECLVGLLSSPFFPDPSTGPTSYDVGRD